MAAVACVVTSGVLPVFLTGAMAVQLREDLGIGEAAQGTAIAVFFLAAAAGSAALGRAAERVGAVRSMRLGALAAAGALVTGAAAPNVAVLMAALVLGGAANALTQPAANLFIARSIPAARLGLAFAVKQAGVPAATLLGGALVPAVALTVGWRWSFVAGAAVAVLGAVAVTTPARPGDGAERIAGTVGPGRVALGPLVVLATAIAFGSASASALGGFLVSALVEAGMGEGAAGAVVAAGSAFGISVRLLSGHRADRREGGHLRIVSRMLAGGTIAYVLLATGDLRLMVGAIPIAFGLAWGWPGLFNLAVVREHPQAPGTASGITQTGTYLGAVAGPLVFGVVAEHVSYSAAWLTAGGLCAAAALGMLAGRSALRRARTRRDPLGAAPV